MARCVGATSSRPPQVTRPRVGGTRPMMSRRSVVLPAPFGPIRTVGDPAASASEIRSRIVTPPATKLTSSSTIGRSVTGARMVIPQIVRRRAAGPRPAAFTTTTMAISTTPSPIASGRSPFEVSSAIAVVMVRVKPSILPPTMRMAPTSAAARPKPASSAVTRLKRPSQIKRRDAPRADRRPWPRARRGTRSTSPRWSAASAPR